MAKNVVLNSAGVFGASVSNQRVSQDFQPRDLFNIEVNLQFSALTVTNGITFKLQDSFDNGATWYDVGDQSEIAAFASEAFDATPTTGDVDAGADTLTLTAHGFNTGDQVVYSDGGGTAPTGLVDGTIYYAIDAGTNLVQLSTTQREAYEGQAISLTDDGVGAAHSLEKAFANIRMIWEDSSDQAQLPLQTLCRVVVSSGASDSVTVSHVWIKD